VDLILVFSVMLWGCQYNYAPRGGDHEASQSLQRCSAEPIFRGLC